MFFDRFERMCSQKGVSCSRAAKEIGLSNATTTKWKKTGATPNGDTLSKIASYFGVSVDYLLDYTGQAAIDDLSWKIDDAKQYLATLTDEAEIAEQKNAIRVMNESLDDMMLIRSLGWTGENKKSPGKAEAFRDDIQNLLSRSTDEQIQEVIRYWEYIISK